MDIQTIFYTLGSIFLFLWLVVLVAILVLIWKAYQALQKTHQSINELKDNVTARVSDLASSGSTRVASGIGMGIASFILRRLRNMKKD